MTSQEAQAILNQQPQANNSLSPAEAQAILAQMPQQQPQVAQQQSQPSVQQPAQSMGLLPSIGAHVLGDAATIGGDLLNIPHNIDNKIPAYQPNYNYYNALGVQPNLADKVGVGAAEYLPYDTGAGEAVKALEIGGKYAPMLARNVLGSTAYGIANNPSTIQGALTGAGTGVASTALGLGAGALGRGVANVYAKTALPGLVQKGNQAVMSGLGNLSDYAQTLKNNYDDAAENAQTLLGQRLNVSKNLDQQVANQVNPVLNANNNIDQQVANINSASNRFVLPGSVTNQLNAEVENLLSGKKSVPNNLPNQFDPSGFVNALQGIKANLQDTIGKEKNTMYDNSLAHVNSWLEDPPTTWQMATQRAQTINDAPNIYAAANNNSPDKYLGGIAGQARNALKQSVLENSFKAPNSDINNLWQQANQAYGKQMSYYESPPKNGNTLQYNKTLANAMQGEEKPDSAIFDEFLPSPTQTGTNGITHLGTLMDSQPAANNALLSYALRQPAENGLTNQSAMGLYSKLSPDQRDLMFSGNAGQPYLSAANTAAKTYGKPAAEAPSLFAKGGMGHYGLHLGLTGAAGIGAGLAMGLPFDEALMLGAGTAAVGHGIGAGVRATATPGRVIGAMNYGQSPIQGRLGIGANYLANPGVQH